MLPLYSVATEIKIRPKDKPLSKPGHRDRCKETVRFPCLSAMAAGVALLAVSIGMFPRQGRVLAQSAPAPPASGGGLAHTTRDTRDSFPESARLDTSEDRENFVRWVTFLAETQFYAPSFRTRAEVNDCAALVRFAYRNALVSHSPAWREEAGLPFYPGFGDITKYKYPHGPLGRALFRTGPEPVAGDRSAAFGEFADSATLLRFNAFPISRDLRAAQPGDLLFFHQSVDREPFHTMLFVGRSYYRPQGSDWIVYHTGDMNGQRGEIREVQAASLLEHPDLHWRPQINNPNFLGVYRLEILR